MMRILAASGALFLLLAGPAVAEEAVTCKGNITSRQGEGLVVKTFHFEVGEVTGSDLQDVLEKFKKIALQRQNKAARPNPGIAFRKFSEVDLACSQGARKFTVQRTLRTN